MNTETKPLPSFGTDLPDIEGAWLAFQASRIKQNPQNNLRASDLGTPCDRYHFHAIHDWKERVLHDPERQGIFEEGNLHEKATTITLMEMGFEVVEQQRAFQIDKPLITGHIDGKLRWKGRVFPYDVKSIQAFDFDKITSAEDLLFSKKVHLRKYPAQLQLYLLMTGEEVGAFILKNKTTGRLRPIWMALDYDFCEQLLKRAERVYAALKAETPPERTTDFDVCMKCPFRHICLPDLKAGPGVQAIDDVELAGMLERREQLAPMAEEFEKLDDQVKDAAKAGGAGEKVCGDFLLRVKEQTRKTKVALTWEEKETSFLVTKILKLDAGKK
jgi:hypothetical protein